MATHLWQITAKTNLHVGDENTAGSGVIDKAVQRDVLTTLPCINSSSLKGALNEFCKSKEVMSEDDRNVVFGSMESGKGKAVFFDAKLLCFPIQCDDVPYKLTTVGEVLDELIERAGIFGLKVNKDRFVQYLNSDMSFESFKKLCKDDHLPIIARNKLDNGISENLWYEQVVPSETVFYTIIQDVDDDKLTNAIENQYIQIGANATIGYGVCLFTKVI